MQRQGQLDDAEVGPQVPTGAGNRGDQVSTDLASEDDQVLTGQSVQVAGTGDGGQQRRTGQCGIGHCRLLTHQRVPPGPGPPVHPHRPRPCDIAGPPHVCRRPQHKRRGHGPGDVTAPAHEHVG